jgi:hypothetical protein
LDERGSEAHDSDSEAKANSLIDRFWERLLQEEPMLGTWIGDERYDDRLPDPSESGLAARRDF